MRERLRSARCWLVRIMEPNKAKETQPERGKAEVDFHAEMAQIAKQVSKREMQNGIVSCLLLGIVIGAVAILIPEKF
jgi:hypothetical protein